MGSYPRRRRRRSLLAFALVILILGADALVGTPATAMIAAPRCTSQPAAGAVDAGIPWPQARYDFAGLSQITEGAGITVAVVDSGVNPVTPQLAGAVTAGGDMLDATGDGRLDCVGHGTAVASIIAARPRAGSGLRGLAPAAEILAVRVSEKRPDQDGAITGAGDLEDLVDGIRAAVQFRPRPQVINLSISTPADNPALRAAIQSALDADIVVVAAVGNSHGQNGTDPVPYPAAYDGVVGVGAIGPTGERFSSSQVGSYVDIVAPGEGVIGATVDGGHQPWQGTSFATPFVAATAALIRARWPGMSRTEVVRRLLATADPAAGARPSADYGYGVVNPMRALTEIVPGTVVEAAHSPTPVIKPGALGDTGPRPPTTLALAAALVLLLVTGAIVGVATALPAGRRRNWRPGRVDPT